MNYPTVSVDNAAKELNRLHGEIENKLRTTVQDAIRAGEILTQVKDRLDHGEFLPWIKQNCRFTDRTAESYMKLHRHSNKIESVSNLQEAYNEVAQIESREKQTEEQRARQRVKEYLVTGEKPDGWRRGTDDMLVEEERARDRRIEEAKRKAEELQRQRDEERKAREEDRRNRDRQYDNDGITSEMLKEAADRAIERDQRKQEFKQRIRLSQAGESDQFIDALMDYLEELPDDNRRIEACQNIIKVCRNIAAGLQT